MCRGFSMETCSGSKLLAGIMLAEKRFRLWLKGVFNAVFERLSCDCAWDKSQQLWLGEIPLIRTTQAPGPWVKRGVWHCRGCSSLLCCCCCSTLFKNHLMPYGLGGVLGLLHPSLCHGALLTWEEQSFTQVPPVMVAALTTSWSSLNVTSFFFFFFYCCECLM